MVLVEKPSAAGKLRPSKLTAQLEGLGQEIDVTAINLDVKGRAAMRIRGAITDATLARTAEGASTLTLEIEDRDLAITNSGVFGSDSLSLNENVGTVKGTQVVFGNQVDCELDGLWFRMVAWSKPATSRVLTVTFEDREIALLRSYPRQALGQSLHWAFDSSMTRVQVMLALIAQVREVPIRVVAPMFTGNDNAITASALGLDKTSLAIAHQPGFASFADVTVKGQAATKVQHDVIQAVLFAGLTIRGLPRALLTAAIMVITDESDAGANVGFSARAVGAFQQDPTMGWPATGDPGTDAGAFFRAALTLYQSDPSEDLALIAARVQKPQAWIQSGDTSMYGRYRTEAEHTVSEFLGLTDIVTTQASASPFVPQLPAEILHGQFIQGSVATVGSKTVVVKESNWAMLQRLATEVGWWCYCVSGTIYIEDPEHLFQQKARFVFDEGTDGVDGIGVDLDTGKKNAVVTVKCRAGRWVAPPGTVGQIRSMGPGNGRWIVTNIERSLFDTLATITLKKPQRPLADPESAIPVVTSGAYVINPDGSKAQFAPGATSARRDAIVAAAKKALADKNRYAYLQIRPMPVSLTIDPLEEIDCSAFATLCYKAAALPDPNGLAYNGQGDTASLYTNSTATTQPQPGDLAFYLPWDLENRKPHHVAVVTAVAGSAVTVIEMGSRGVNELDATSIGLPLLGYYQPDVLA